MNSCQYPKIFLCVNIKANRKINMHAPTRQSFSMNLLLLIYKHVHVNKSMNFKQLKFYRNIKKKPLLNKIKQSTTETCIKHTMDTHTHTLYYVALTVYNKTWIVPLEMIKKGVQFWILSIILLKFFSRFSFHRSSICHIRQPIALNGATIVEKKNHNANSFQINTFNYDTSTLIYWTGKYIRIKIKWINSLSLNSLVMAEWFFFCWFFILFWMKCLFIRKLKRSLS